MTTKPKTLAALKVEVSGSGYGSVSATDTAKLVRHWLKTEFPGVKFSVTTDRYSMGAALNVDWTDGPTVQEVDAVVAPFVGEGFDGMTDGTTHNMAWLFPDCHAVRFASEIGHSAGTVVRDAGGNKLDAEQQHDYIAGVLTEVQGETTRRGYDPDSYAYQLGRSDARSLTAAGARLVSFHADHIMTHRSFGPEYRAYLERAVVFLAGFGGEFDGDRRYDVLVQLPGGSEDYGHTLVYRLSRLDDPGQLDAWIAEEAERRAIHDNWLWNAQASEPGNQEARGEQRAELGLVGYYVTVMDGNQWGALLGPYDTRDDAQADVPEGKRLAQSVNDRAIWYGYGVSKVTGKPGADLEPGKLEKLPERQLALAFPEPAAAVTA
jgi:hypothetical protein